MKILGIDTSTKFLSIGICDNDKIYEYNLELGRKHSVLLVPTIKRIIDALGWDLKKVDYLSCGLGPGSFTGLRIGVATLKGLSFSLNKPILGISTLDILAKNSDRDGIIMPAVDAKRNLVYSAIYRKCAKVLKRISPYMLLPVDEFLKKARPNSTLLGDGLALYKDEILKNVKGAYLLDRDYWYPQGRNIIELSFDQIKEKRFSDAFKINPIYLYPKECQIKAAKVTTIIKL